MILTKGESVVYTRDERKDPCVLKWSIIVIKIEVRR